MLVRLYDVTSGNIYIDGIDVRNYEEKDLKSKFGTALQYDTLFSGSIYDNIDFYRNLNKKEIEKAIRVSQADFVNNLEKGLKSDVSPRGTNFSGGQKQRLIIARALAGNPEILILDDSSSALDYKTDAKLRKAISEEYKDTTTIVISSYVLSKYFNKVIGDVNFNNVYFGYQPDKMILKDVSFNAEAGKTIAIVGPIGAGKTTIVKLLMRFYDVNDGIITLDNEPINLVKRNNLRKSYAMVLQETWLFDGSIYENLTYGSENATKEEVEEVIDKAKLTSFIKRLPDGYNTLIKDGGSNISKGQKQLLTIARAMLLKANMLILDEATSNVDTRTEIKIQEAMKELMKNRTTFIIAHKLSTIQNADLILVVKDGNIIEQGTHKELLNNKGFYFELYNSQFK